MASLMLTGCSSFTTSHIILSNRPDGAFLPRRCLRTTLSGRRGCVLSVRCSSEDAAMVMDGWPVAAKMIAEINTEVSRMKKSTAAVPGLAGIVIGDRMESEAYMVPCELVGIKTSIVRLPQNSSEEKVLKSVSRFNDDPCVHGITVQMPLPSDVNARDGFRIVGDICYEEVCKVASAFTTFEGSIGLMTSLMLLSNTLTATKRTHDLM